MDAEVTCYIPGTSKWKCYVLTSLVMKKPPEKAMVIIDVVVCSSVAGVNVPTSARPDVRAASQQLHRRGSQGGCIRQGKVVMQEVDSICDLMC